MSSWILTAHLFPAEIKSSESVKGQEARRQVGNGPVNLSG